jgi:hypothetical protein
MLFRCQEKSSRAREGNAEFNFKFQIEIFAFIGFSSDFGELSRTVAIMNFSSPRLRVSSVLAGGKYFIRVNILSA